jgi:hypothetical protein
MRQLRVPLIVLTVATALAFASGLVLAAYTIGNLSETGGGNYVNAVDISWEDLAATNPTSVGLVPSTVPGALSSSAASPTILPTSATSYSIGSAMAGDFAVIFHFQEQTSAPTSTELGVTVWVSYSVNSGSGATTFLGSATFYVETQTTIPGSAVTISAYFDLGSPSVGALLINFAETALVVCSPIGTCPP